MADDEIRGASIADVLNSIRWEFVPDRDEVSLLEPMQRYFDDFPWEGGPRQEDHAKHFEEGDDLDFKEEIEREKSEEQ